MIERSALLSPEAFPKVFGSRRGTERGIRVSVSTIRVPDNPDQTILAEGLLSFPTLLEDLYTGTEQFRHPLASPLQLEDYGQLVGVARDSTGHEYTHYNMFSLTITNEGPLQGRTFLIKRAKPGMRPSFQEQMTRTEQLIEQFDGKLLDLNEKDIIRFQRFVLATDDLCIVEATGSPIYSLFDQTHTGHTQELQTIGQWINDQKWSGFEPSPLAINPFDSRKMERYLHTTDRNDYRDILTILEPF